MMIESIIISALSAAVYSFIFYAKSKASDPDEKFNQFKFMATIAVGIAVGIGYRLAGEGFSQDTISNQLTLYAGTVALVETVLKITWRRCLKKIVSSG